MNLNRKSKTLHMDRIISLFLAVVVLVAIFSIHAQAILYATLMVVGVAVLVGGLLLGIGWSMDSSFFGGIFKLLLVWIFITLPGYALCVFSFHHLQVM